MTTTTIDCPTPKTGQPAPKGKPEAGVLSKLASAVARKSKPVPAAEENGNGIPAFLDRTKGLSPEQGKEEVRKLTANKKELTMPKPKIADPKAKAKAKQAAQARADGLRAGTKQAIMLDALIAAGDKGITEDALCKKLGGWKACAVTLRRVCDRTGTKLENREGRFYGRKGRKS